MFRAIQKRHESSRPNRRRRLALHRRAGVEKLEDRRLLVCAAGSFQNNNAIVEPPKVTVNCVNGNAVAFTNSANPTITSQLTLKDPGGPAGTNAATVATRIAKLKQIEFVIQNASNNVALSKSIKIGDFVPSPSTGTFDFDVQLFTDATNQTGGLAERVHLLELFGDNAADATRTLTIPFSITVDLRAPNLLSITAPTSPRTTPVSSIDVSLVETNFKEYPDAVTLKRNDVSVSLSGISTSKNKINGLAVFNQTPGTYTLSVDPTKIEDLAGNKDSGSVQSVTWTVEVAGSPDLIDEDDSARSDLMLGNSDDITNPSLLNSGGSLTFQGDFPGDASKVQLRINGAVEGSDMSPSGGKYEITIPASRVDQLASVGSESILSVVSENLDANDVAGPFSETLFLRVDRVGPPAATLSLQANSDSSVDNDQITFHNTPSFTVSAVAPSSVPPADDYFVILTRDSAGTANDSTTNVESVTDAESTITDSTEAPEGTSFYTVQLIDRAGNTSSSSNEVKVVFDTRAPNTIETTSGSEVRSDTVTANATSRLFSASNLPVEVVQLSQTGTVDVDVQVFDQSFLEDKNLVTIQLCLTDCSTPSDVLDDDFLEFDSGADGDAGPKMVTLSAPASALKIGVDNRVDNRLTVRLTDTAGNTTSIPYTFFVSRIGGPTISAPNTPVLTTLYDIQAKLNAAIGEDAGRAVQPWQMSFDKTTQTVWLASEKAGTIAQFDPATGYMKIIDLREPSSAGDNPHGVFFDFNTHLTPRIFAAQRNAGGSAVGQAAIEGDGKLTYIDIGDEKLVTFEFDEIKQREISPGKTIQQFLAENDFINGRFDAFHAVFADATGDVWVSVPESQALLRFDFDDVNSGCGLDCDFANVTIHPLPVELSGTEQAKAKLLFNPHAFQVIVDDQKSKAEGNQWVWMIDVAGSGRIALLRPGVGPGGLDQWSTWEIGQTGVSGTFVQIDDNETPGTPEDDAIITTFPVQAGSNGKPASSTATVGVVNRLKLVDPTNPINSAIEVETWTFPKIPGASAAITLAGVNQPFVDRNGQVFVVDRFGSAIRFNPSEFRSKIDGFYSGRSQVAAESISAKQSFDLGQLTPTSIRPFAPSMVSEFTLDPTTEIIDKLTAGFSEDRATLSGFDQYEVSGTNNNALIDTRGAGAFRGALNASNVLYSSLSQAETLSVTIFAESARRQMSVATKPDTPEFATPAGVISEARMAFQVLRNGSLVLTARGDGMIADEQINLLAEMVNKNRITETEAAELLITGEANAVTASDGSVHVVGRSVQGGIVQYTYTPVGTDWDHEDIFQMANWQVNPHDIGDHVLAEDPVPAGKLGFAVTTAAGHLLSLPIDNPKEFRDLTLQSGEPMAGRVYSATSTIEFGDNTFVYGTNQTGSLIEYSVTESGAAVREILNINPVTSAIDRDIRMMRNVRAMVVGGTRHIFATDGTSRLVHWTLDANGNIATAENISQQTADNGQNFGYFPFQKPFTGRVYTYVAPLVEDDGTIRVYGTNGGELIEFTLPPSGQWRVANLTNDTNGTYGDDGPGFRVPANAVFGGPTAYMDSNGGRHILQINGEGEVVEYFTYGDKLFPNSVDADRINSQNVNFFSGKSPTKLSAELSERISKSAAPLNITPLKTTPAETTTLETTPTPTTTTPTVTETTPPPVQTPAETPTPAPTPTPRIAAAEDVNQDGVVTAQDALLIINYLPRTVGGGASAEQTANSPYNLDVNGDTQVTALDALRVINYLNKASSQGQSESIALDLNDEDSRSWQSEVDGVMSDIEESQLF